MMKLIRWSGAFLVAVLFTAVSANAMMITPGGASDAVVGHDWGAFFSPSTWVQSDASATIGADYDPSDPSYRWWHVAQMEFPIASLVGQTDLAASLQIYVTGGGGDMQLRYCGDGTGTVTASSGIFNAGSVVETFSGAATGWHEFDISTQLQAAVDSGFDWIKFTVRSADWWTGATLASSESGELSPAIHVIPEPATMAMIGLGGLMMIRRRKA